jgi:UDP-N-acetylmuramoylalanine--D-glutamate ligase
VVNRDDGLVWSHAQGLKAQLFPFSRTHEMQEGIFHRDGLITFRHNGLEESFPTGGLRLQGVHNLENIMAALACGLLLGCRPEKSFEVARDFESLHHRMEFVRKFKGVSYYEDSKATNVGSVEKALESFDNITLIAGGKDKGGSYAPLVAPIQERVRHLILIGEAADRMQLELGSRSGPPRRSRPPAERCSCRRPAPVSTCSGITRNGHNVSSLRSRRSSHVQETGKL